MKIYFEHAIKLINQNDIPINETIGIIPHACILYNNIKFYNPHSSVKIHMHEQMITSILLRL